MKKLNLLASCLIFLGALLLLSGAVNVYAQTPGQHPNYLHAIHDLRQARGWLQITYTEPAHAQAAAAALPEINEAIDSLKLAAHVDEKSMSDVPAPNTNTPPNGRFHYVKDLLSAARRDTSMPESDPAALIHQKAALQHIMAAEAAINKVL
jgi:hypothetical protein